ncbi:MAG: hypothetical protein M3Y56_16665 [Armatimonadota bacterium]|nr:hypothetical protein [Armatimonadota bacterium]
MEDVLYLTKSQIHAEDVDAWLRYHHAYFQLYGTAPDLGGIEISAFLTFLEHVVWFERLGLPSSRDHEVDRITGWDEWPGPQEPEADLWADQFSEMYAEVQDIAKVRGVDLQPMWKQIQEIVVRLAAPMVPDYEEGRDAWYAPTTCVWSAACDAGLVGCYLFLHEAPPPVLRLAWGWNVEGHWPCACRVSSQDTKMGRLIVY